MNITVGDLKAYLESYDNTQEIQFMNDGEPADFGYIVNVARFQGTGPVIIVPYVPLTVS